MEGKSHGAGSVLPTLAQRARKDGAPTFVLEETRAERGEVWATAPAAEGGWSWVGIGSQNPRPVAENATRTGHPSFVEGGKGWASLPRHHDLTARANCPTQAGRWLEWGARATREVKKSENPSC